MKAVISSSHDDKYYYFIPIVVYLWKKLGVDVICFTEGLNFPVVTEEDEKWVRKAHLVEHYTKGSGLIFKAVLAPKNKMCTYLQCSRLYGACLDLPEDEVLITSDVDMAIFKGLMDKFEMATNQYGNMMTILGIDLVPKEQVPVCYVWGSVKNWRDCFGLHDKTYQQCLDELLGKIEAEHFRGNYWGKDQEELYNKISRFAKIEIQRARPNTQFASHRVDRDDIGWRNYVDENLVDAHLWRDGYTDANFANILELLTMKFPDENFDWLIDYTNAYKQLL